MVFYIVLILETNTKSGLRITIFQNYLILENRSLYLGAAHSSFKLLTSESYISIQLQENSNILIFQVKVLHYNSFVFLQVHTITHLLSFVH